MDSESREGDVSVLRPLILVGLVLIVAFGIRQWRTAGPSEENGADRSEPYVREFPILGTYASLKLWAPASMAEPAADAAVSELVSLHRLINIFSDKSELSRLNDSAYDSPFPCSASLWQVLGVCREAYRETDGAFDITVGPLLQLWGFHRERETLPTDREVSDALAAVGLDKVVFDDERRTVRFTHPDTYFDLGGMAKGYALDFCVRILRAHGIDRGLVDLGGNIYCLSEPPPGQEAYRIGVRHPFEQYGLLGKIRIRDRAVATSGNYEQFREIEGQRVHHIIDPRTGRPVPRVASVTVVTPSGIDSDVYATAVFVAGESMVKALRERSPEASVLRVRQGDRAETVVERYGAIWDDIENGRTE